MNQEPQKIMPPSSCPVCHNPMKNVKGISKKTNRPYDFWSCSGYPNCDYTWRQPTRQDIQHEETLEAMRKIYEKLNEMDDKMELGFGQLLVDKEEKKK